MANAIQLAIRRRTQCDRLNACRLMAHHRIHLRTSKLDANRHPQFPCSKSREKRVRPDITFAPEATAQEFTYNVDLFGGYAEHHRHQLFRSEDMLGCFIKSQRAVGVPGRDRRVRLHRIVVSIGRRVGVFDPDWAAGDRLVSVTN